MFDIIEAFNVACLLAVLHCGWCKCIVHSKTVTWPYIWRLTAISGWGLNMTRYKTKKRCQCNVNKSDDSWNELKYVWIKWSDIRLPCFQQSYQLIFDIISSQSANPGTPRASTSLGTKGSRTTGRQLQLLSTTEGEVLSYCISLLIACLKVMNMQINCGVCV